WDRLRGADGDKFRINPRKAWYRNVEEITTNGDYEVAFHLKRSQPYLIALLASGQSPVFTFATIPLLKDLKAQAPQAVCDVVMDNTSRDLLINPAAPPFDNADRPEPRPAGLHRHPCRRTGRGRRRGFAAARRRLGPAPRYPANAVRIWPRCSEEPRRGPR